MFLASPFTRGATALRIGDGGAKPSDAEVATRSPRTQFEPGG